MSTMMRVRVMRGGRKVVRWRRRPQYRSVPPTAVVPTEPVATAVGTQVRQLEEEVRDGLRKMPASARPRRMQRLTRRLVDRAAWWWLRIRWKLYCQSWLLGFIVDQVRRCRDLWRRLQLRMLIRRVQREAWRFDWRFAAPAPPRSKGRLTSPCT